MIPRVYKFISVTPDRIPNICHVVARNDENAVKWFRDMCQKHHAEIGSELPEQFCYIIDSWVAQLLILLLPWYHHTYDSPWSAWELF